MILADGRTIEGDVVMPFFGLMPSLEFMVGSGVDIERGLLVNPELKTTDAHIWAAGDVCQIWSADENAYRFYYGWKNVKAMGELAARNMTGERGAVSDVHRGNLDRRRARQATLVVLGLRLGAPRMSDTDIQIAICGSAGDGTIAAGGILNQAMAQAGYKVIAFDVYPAEIRGFGECIACSRITSAQVYSLKAQSDVLVSLNDGHAIAHVPEVRDFGAVIYDDAPISTLKEGQHISGHIKPSQLPYGLPMRELSERATSAAKSRNMVALGYLAGLYGMPREAFHATIGSKFKGKAAAIAEGNVKAFDAGYAEGQATFRLDFNELGPAPESSGDAVMMSGNQAVVQGCLEAGVETFFGYPITPATTILEMLAARLPKQGGRVLQTEDEIAALGAAIGAGYAGVRAATATSGPGLALMTEMLGLGVMAEVPAVIFVSQRGGPSTGMPTKTEQSDLNLAVFGGSGDARRIVLAPTNVEGCYRCAGRAFELAEKYQTPVIVLLDLYLSNRLESVTGVGKTRFAPNLSKGLSARAPGVPYQRFALTDDWVSPRAIPGEPGGIHTVTGLEHNELGRPKDTPGRCTS